MKKTVVIISMIAILAASAFAEDKFNYGSAEGEWKMIGSRLYQQNSNAPRAKFWVEVPQNGSMIYEFTMRYEGGVEDGHGGVGIHILADSAPQGEAWGMGESWLLWLNYDVDPESSQVPAGLSAQIYRSTSNSEMEIVKSISLRAVEQIAARYINSTVPVKLTYFADTGRVVISDPRGIVAGWYVTLPKGRNESGQYVAVRTNSASVSFASSDVNL